jgi:NADH dehydrogenase (ubiquinone) 1 alpha subcomplex subunit 1
VESIPPFAIIVGAITAMGGLQYLTHGAAYAKPRAIGQDAFDRLVAARDERVKTAAASGRGAQK